MEPARQEAINLNTITKKKFISQLSDGIDRFFKFIVGAAIIVELIVMFGNMICRWLLGFSFQGIDEIGELSLTIIAFIGGAIAYPRGDHVAVEILYKVLPQRWHRLFGALSTWFLVCISFISSVLTIEIVFKTTLVNKTDILRISDAWYSLPIIIGFLLLVYYGLKEIWSFPRKTSLISGAVVIGVSLVGILTHSIWINAFNSGSALGFTLVAIAILLVIGVPIGFVLSAGSMLYLYVSHTVSTTAAPLAIQNSMMNFILLAIPFFVMAGLVMTGGGLSKRLIHFIMSLIGRVRGGLYHVIIISTYIMSGLSGSKVADVTAVGTTMNDTLQKEGYDAGETASVLAAAAVMGETVPPCMNMLVLGSISSLSIGTLFIAGIIPAVVVAIVLMILISIRSRIVGMPISPRVHVKEMGKRGLIAIPALITPVLLVGGITAGIGTPTEVSTSAVLYSILLGFFIYKELSLRSLWEMTIETASKAGMVLFIVGNASSFSWSLTVAQVPNEIANAMVSLAGHSSIVFMLLSILILILMGSILEGLPAILIFAPLLLPIAPQFGFSPIQFGLILVISMGLGNFLPPIGVGSYICIAVTKSKLEDMMKHMLPYIAALIVGILIIAFVPWFTLLLPRLFHLIN